LSEGICYLVGAGPGDPGLLTLRGLECLQRADVVLHDDLVSDPVMALVPDNVELIPVGKRAGRHSRPQEEINSLLCHLVKEGRVVVRLKGGDPFVFGRGGEEVEALVNEGCAFEVVPGITAAVASAAYAGIPVTHRGHSACVTLITGHEAPDKSGSSLDYAALAATGGTLCFYMGVGRLEAIANRLIENGRNASEPVAVVASGTTPHQRTVTGSLADIAGKVAAAGIAPPAVVIVGDVVAERHTARWFDELPLFGRHVLVTRTKTQAGELGGLLRGRGAWVSNVPAVAIEAAEKRIPSGLRGAIASGATPSAHSLAEADPLTRTLVELRRGRKGWVVFTSVNGVRYAFKRLAELGMDTRAFGSSAVAAIGSATRKALRAEGIEPDLVPSTYTSHGLFHALRERLGDSIAETHFTLLRSAIAPPDLPAALAEAGGRVDKVVAYRTIVMKSRGTDTATPAIPEGLDAVTFASSSAVQGFANLAGAIAKKGPRPRMVSIGPVTSKAMRDAGLPVDAEASEHTMAGLVATVEQLFSG